MKRTYQAKLPDGRIVQRNTKSFHYRYIGIADVPGLGWAIGGWSETEVGAIKLAKRYYTDALTIFAIPVQLVAGHELV